MLAFPWLSACLFLLANVAFGAFLHDSHASPPFWLLAGLYIAIQAAALSVAWKPVRNFFLLGFKSDLGYAVMALGGASLAVIVLVWLQTFIYFLVMLAAALLLRIDLLARNLSHLLCFVIMVLLSLLGLGLSWLPTWLLAHLPGVG
jgi:hypothetical protein